MRKLTITFCIVFCIINSFLFVINSYGITADGSNLYQGIDVSGWQGYINYEVSRPQWT